MTWLEKITEKILRRIPQIVDFEDGRFLLQDLIEDAACQIVTFAQANAYDKKWDNLLVNCVVTLFNYEGQEGSTSRDANGVKDVYGSSSILSELLAANIAPYIRPSGSTYNSNRFDLPTD